MEIERERSEVHSLRQHVTSQQLIITRFNNTVTNADLENELVELKKSLRGAETYMLNEMQETKSSIQNVLNNTIRELDLTVSNAQNEITHQVKSVEKSFEKYARTTQDQFSMLNNFMRFQLAGTFTLLACLISMWHMTTHLRNFKRPVIQRKILAILWMTPIYGLTSWLSLLVPQFEAYLAIVKDFYEAYIIYQFLSFLISVLGKGDRDAVVDLLARRTDTLEPPMRCCGWFRAKYPFGTPRTLANSILLQCQLFAMQFVFLKPLLSISLFVINIMNHDRNGMNDKLSLNSIYLIPKFWIIVVQNISVLTAFSGLVKFYHVAQEDLVKYNPFSKFLCVNGIVFMTFWQGFVIDLLAIATTNDNVGQASGMNNENPDIWGKQAQNFLICLEMLLFSIAHFYCFPTCEWEEGYRPYQWEKKKFGDNIALNDFVADLKLIIRGDNERESKYLITDEASNGNQRRQAQENIDSDSVNHSLKKSESGDIITQSYDSEEDETIRNMSDKNRSLDEDDSAECKGESFDTIKIVIRQSLTAPDTDVREAANRLLQSSSVLEEELNAETVRGALEDHSSTFASMQPIGGVPFNEEDLLCETSSLLTHSNKELRPSVFTAVGNLNSSSHKKSS